MARLGWFALSLLVVGLDLCSKLLAQTLLSAAPLAILPGLNLRLGYNPGAAWGFLAWAGGWQRWVLAGLALGISLFLLTWLYRTGGKPRSLCCGLALVSGGAIGNLYDRLTLGMVVDFIDIYWRHWHWPTFNLADAAITLGGILIAWDTLRRPVG